MKSWKSEAKRLFAMVKARGLWTDELADRNYAGAGGVVYPSGQMRMDLAPDDVGYEQLAEDCRFTLEQGGVS